MRFSTPALSDTDSGSSDSDCPLPGFTSRTRSAATTTTVTGQSTRQAAAWKTYRESGHTTPVKNAGRAAEGEGKRGVGATTGGGEREEKSLRASTSGWKGKGREAVTPSRSRSNTSSTVRSTNHHLLSPVPPSRTSPSPFARPPPSSIASSPLGGTPFRVTPRRPSRLRSHSSISASSASSSASSESEDGDDSDAGSEEEEDSEDELFPVSRHPRRHPSALPTCALPSAPDPLTQWATKSTTQNSTYRSALVASQARRQHLEHIHAKSLHDSAQASSARHQSHMEELTDILNRIDIAKEAEAKRMGEAFAARSRERDMAIEELVRAAEREEQEAVIRERRRKEAEAVAKAQRDREIAQAAELARQAAEAEAQAKAAAAAASRAAAEKQAAEDKVSAAREAADREAQEKLDSVSGKAKEEYVHWGSVMKGVKEKVLPAVAGDEELKKMCRAAKRKITPKVGQLTNDAAQITRVIQDISAVLKSLHSTSQPAYLWSLNHLSKSLIKQSETEVTAKLSTVYPLARLVVGLLLLDHPFFGNMFMARLTKKCFFVVGYRPPHHHGQSDDEYRKQLGYAPGEDSIKYGNRLAGIMALYAAICQQDHSHIVPGLSASTPHLASLIPPHFRPSAPWTLLTRLLTPPFPTLFATPQLLSTLIEVAGEAMADVYGKQWMKVLGLVLVEGIRGGKGGWHKDARPNVLQLQVMLEGVEERGRMGKVPGRALEG